MLYIFKCIRGAVSKTSLFMLACTFFLLAGCKKLIEVHTPTTNISGENVFNSDGTAISLLTGIYTQISSNSLPGGDLVSIGFLTGLSGDELTTVDGSSSQELKNYYLNSLPASSQPNIWNNIYPKIYIVNTVIEKIPTAVALNPAVKQQLLGEAKFMRAFFFFYLVNLYGDVPLVVSTDYTINSVLPRTPKDQVWSQIILDLLDAKQLLTPNYLDGTLLIKTPERVRPNRWAATALLSRCYLYTRDWKSAELQSTEVIDNSALYHLDSLYEVFKRNNWEAIWQLQPVNYASNTEDAKTYIIRSSGFSSFKPVHLSTQLVENFESSDKRRNFWVDSINLSASTYYFASKYKSDSLNAPITEYNTVLRLGEQFLIRAEARAQQKNIKGALEDLNIIRRRAWLTEAKIDDVDPLLSAIYHERQSELFTEWGHRWLDLKRTQLIDKVMRIVSTQKGGNWSPNWGWYPIPPYDISVNGRIKQNLGY